MFYNLSALSYRRNWVVFQTVTKRWKSKITILNGRNIMIDNTVMLWDKLAMCLKQRSSIKKPKYV
jgi:hypothetical protein